MHGDGLILSSGWYSIVWTGKPSRWVIRHHGYYFNGHSNFTVIVVRVLVQNLDGWIDVTFF